MQNNIHYVTHRISGPKFLTDMQFKALGYRVGDSQRVQEMDFERDPNSIFGKSPTTKWVRYASYGRHTAYPTNIFLGLVSGLVTAVRFIRGIVKFLVPFAIVIFMLGDIPDEVTALAAAVVGGYFITWAATILLMILAKVIRVVFRIDERMDEICISNGWMPWSEYDYV